MLVTWVGVIPWRRKWQSTPVVLPGEAHAQRSLVGCSPRSCKELDVTENSYLMSPPTINFFSATCLPIAISISRLKNSVGDVVDHVHRPWAPSLTTALDPDPPPVSVRSHVSLKEPQQRAKSPGQLLINRSELSRSLGSQETGSIPGLGRSPGEGKGYPLQYSGLENSMDYIVHGVAKSWQ